MYLTKGKWESNKSDLLVEIIKVSYRSKDYTKVKLNLFHKKYGYLYEFRSNYKLYHTKIDHWYKVFNK